MYIWYIDTISAKMVIHMALRNPNGSEDLPQLSTTKNDYPIPKYADIDAEFSNDPKA